jgi:hypothetical protein
MPLSIYFQNLNTFMVSLWFPYGFPMVFPMVFLCLIGFSPWFPGSKISPYLRGALLRRLRCRRLGWNGFCGEPGQSKGRTLGKGTGLGHDGWFMLVMLLLYTVITYDVVIMFDIFKMYVMMHHGVSFCTL